MTSRTTHIQFTLTHDETRNLFVATVHPDSYGPFPEGQIPKPFEADTPPAAERGLKQRLRTYFSRDRIRLIEVKAA